MSLLVECIERCVWYISWGHFERKVKSLMYSWDNSRAHKSQLHGVILNVKIPAYFYSMVNITLLFLHIFPFITLDCRCRLSVQNSRCGKQRRLKTPDVSQPARFQEEFVKHRCDPGSRFDHEFPSPKEREQVPAKVVEECSGKNCTSAPRGFRPLEIFNTL